MNLVEIGALIRKAREDKRLSAATLAKWAGVSRVTLAQYEAGRGPKFTTLFEILHHAGVRINVTVAAKDGSRPAMTMTTSVRGEGA